MQFAVQFSVVMSPSQSHPSASAASQKENSENQEGNRLGRIGETLWSSRGIVRKLSPDNSLIQCATTHTHVIGAHEELFRAIFWV